MKSYLFSFSLILLFSAQLSAQFPIVNLHWAKDFGGPGLSISTSIAVDSRGHTTVVGVFSDSIDIDPGPNQLWYSSKGNFDVFIQQLDINGDFLWGKTIGGRGMVNGLDVEVDPIGNIYVVGDFTDTVDFDPGNGNYDLISNGRSDAFLLKLDTSGDFVAAYSFGSASLETIYDMHIDDNLNIYLSGSFSDSTDFDLSAMSQILVSNGGQDCFIAKWDAAANLVWAKSIGGTTNDVGVSIGVDQHSNIYACGGFGNTVDFDPGNGIDSISAVGGLYDAFLLKLDSNGNYIWSKSYGGPSNDLAYSLAIDTNDVLIVGAFVDSINLNPGVSNPVYLKSMGNTDGFVLRVNSQGMWNSANQFGGPGQDICYKVSANPTMDNYYVIGSFNVSANVVTYPVFQQLVSEGAGDSFIIKFDQGDLPLWVGQIGGPGDEFLNAVDANNIEVRFAGRIADSCDVDPTAVVQRIGFSGSSHALVALMLDQTVGLKENDLINSQIKIFPNPATNILNIEFDDKLNGWLRIFNSEGRRVFEKLIQDQNSIQIGLDYPSGMYFLKVEGNDQSYSKPFIIQH